MKKTILSIFLCASLMITGCVSTDSDQEMSKAGKGTIIGTATGAAVGAVVGQIIGRNTTGTLIGAAVGAAVGGAGGYAIGKHMDNQEKDMRVALQNSQGATVSREGNLLSVSLGSDFTFNTDSAVVKQQFYPEIERIAGVLKQYPDTVIQVQGHTDNTGTSAHNLTLSRQRAESVKTLLKKQGVSASRMEIVGFGEQSPIASNSTPEGRAQNRRVELKIAQPTG